MENIYLQEMKVTDNDLLEQWNNDYKIYSCGKDNPFYTNYKEILRKFEESRNNENEMHLYPYWLIKDGNVIGNSIIKTNIEANEIYKIYGGNISYVISPSYRNKGYGTKFLNLILKKCKELGLSKVIITCNDENIGSRKIIENNYGLLTDVCIDYEKKGKLLRRYIVNIDESLNKYEKNCLIIRPSIIEICNINRNNINDYLTNIGQSIVNVESLKFASSIDNINSISDITNLYKLFINSFNIKIDNNENRFGRIVEDIIISKTIYDSNDAALVLSSILRLKGVPTIFVSCYNINWIQKLRNNFSKSSSKECCSFLEIYLNNKWYLFNPLTGEIYDNYNYNNLSLPNKFYVYRKSINNMSYGCFSINDNNKIMKETFTNFNLNDYKEPMLISLINTNKISFL